MIARRRAVFALLAAAALPARADAVPAADERAMRRTVEAQLAAFRADDAKRAFSQAAPGIRRQFESAEAFMAMVRQSYAVVYRPRSVHFLKVERIDGHTLLPVRMTDAEGQPWLAVYQMERQPGGAWRIAGCQLARSEGQST